MLGFLSWRAASSEQQLRAVERERAFAVAERLLQRAPGSAAAFAAVPVEQRVVRRADGTFDLADVAWLDVADSPLDRDLVVEDRLMRADVAEARAHDRASADAQIEALLAAPLPPAQRLDVLLAAAWMRVRRLEYNEEPPALDEEIGRLVAAMDVADMARPARARAALSAFRLLVVGAKGPVVTPAWADRLFPWLPPDLFASLLDDRRWRAQHDTIVQRRLRLLALRDAWLRWETVATKDGAAPVAAGGVPSLPFATPQLVADDSYRLLWVQPRPGGHELALLTPAEFVAAIGQAGSTAALPELPPPFVFEIASTTGEAPLGVPGLRAVVDPRERDREPAWLRPLLLAGLALGLGVAIAVAVRLQLRAARREVAAARTQAEFLTTVTHELKTPLAGIRLLGEMLAEGRARGREQDYYRMLAGEAERLSQLIQNVLDLGRIERGERAYDLRTHDVGDLVRSTLAWFAPLAQQAGLVVDIALPAGPCPAQLDRDAFVQALVAVLDNARKYGARGGRIDVLVAPQPRALVVAVRDRGPGVPAAEVERVFERFVRGEAHRHGSTPGVGIGLYLARTIVRRLGGDLAVASSAEAEALFALRDPRNEWADSRASETVASNPAVAASAAIGIDGDADHASAAHGPGACFVFRLPTENPA